MAFEFKWYLTEEDWKDYPRKIKEAGFFDGDVNTAGVVGCCRTGNLCFDIRAWGELPDGYGLGYELYVGGIDTGYNETANGYPYDLVDEYGEFTADVLNMDLESFKEKAEMEFDNFIRSVAPDYKRADLIAEANKPLNDWG